MFAFSSLRGSIDARTHKCSYVLKFNGPLHHYVPDFLPQEAEKPKLLQLYFYDDQFEKEHHSGIFPELYFYFYDTCNRILEVWSSPCTLSNYFAASIEDHVATAGQSVYMCRETIGCLLI